MANKHPKQNYTFKKAPQGLDEKKSQGQINLSITKNIIANLRTEVLENTSIIKDLPQRIQEEVKNGKLDNAIKFLSLIKEPEEKNINIKGGIETQKVFVTKEQEQEALKHIEDVINS